jgi:serine/threonine protein kinase
MQDPKEENRVPVGPSTPPDSIPKESHEDLPLDDSDHLASAVTRIDSTQRLGSLDIPFETLGAYRILEVLGRGGMGIVFKAQHQHLEKTVAIKILPSHVTERPAAVARFRREMKAVGAIEHPNLVQAFDAGEIDGTHYIAMEFIVGVDLYHMVKHSGPTSVAAACSIVFQVAQALSAAHQAGIVHRDIKPSNVMISNSGQVKLLDLGLARLLNEEDECTELTSLLHTIGTPDYMAPEQWDNVHNINTRTDLYALGCLFHFLLVGSAPYSAPRYAIPSQKMKGHLLDPIPDLRTSRPEIPVGIVRIYRKMMAKQPQDRFESAETLLSALASYHAEADLTSIMISEPAQTCPIPHVDLSSLKFKTRRMPVKQIIVASLLSGVAGVFAIWFFTRGEEIGDNKSSFSDSSAIEQVEPDQQSRLVDKPQRTPVSSTLTQNSSTPDATGSNQATKVEGELQLWKLITRKTISDGRFEDVQINGENLELDASRTSRQISLDFQDQNGQRLSGKIRLRILNPDRNGYFKIVLLPHGGKPANGVKAAEYYVLLHKVNSDSKVAIVENTVGTERILASHPVLFTKDAIDLELNFELDKMSARVGPEIHLEAPRASKKFGTVAISVRGWSVELERPMLRNH